MSLANYLAKNYLSADKKPKKKKKTQDSTIVENEDVLGWENTSYNDQLDEDEDEIKDPTENVSKKGWKKLTGETTQLKLSKKQKSTEETPTPAHDLMSNGARAGLQTAQQVKEDLDKRHGEELKRFLEDGDELARKNAQTIYRDASGRVINLEDQNEKLKRQQLEKAQKEAKQKERNLGLVQKQELENRKQQLSDSSSINRYADDKDLNRELKSQYRFNDPAARFNKNVKEQREKSKQGNPTTSTGLPTYKGSYNPNRFSIPPGIKWDGVDRSNGFEAVYFKKQNERRENKVLAYTRAFDD